MLQKSMYPQRLQNLTEYSILLKAQGEEWGGIDLRRDQLATGNWFITHERRNGKVVIGVIYIQD